ncbi:hypothetical protein DZC31_21405 [Stenotrophomonas rhizophila]|nr:hypothetical protein DZC31_21405 [Stenotrophomonas rhizophila]
MLRAWTVGARKNEKAVEQDTLVALIESGAAREFRATRGTDGKGWRYCLVTSTHIRTPKIFTRCRSPSKW